MRSACAFLAIYLTHLVLVYTYANTLLLLKSTDQVSIEKDLMYKKCTHAENLCWFKDGNND